MFYGQRRGGGTESGDVVSVTCDEGHSGSGSVTCLSSGSFEFQSLTCTANACNSTLKLRIRTNQELALL
jgi:hypothetical protein